MTPQETPKGRQAPIKKPILKDAPNQDQIDLLKDAFQNDTSSLNTVSKYEAMKKGGRSGLEDADKIIGNIANKLRAGESYSNDIIYLDSALRQVGRTPAPLPISPPVQQPKPQTQAPVQPKPQGGDDIVKPSAPTADNLFDRLLRRMGRKKIEDALPKPPSPTQPKPQVQAPVQQPKPQTQAPVQPEPIAESVEPLDRNAVVIRLQGYLTNDLDPSGFPEPTKSRVILLRKHIEALVSSLEHEQYGKYLLGEPSVIRNITEIDNVMKRVNSQDPNPIAENVINEENNGLLDTYAKARGQIINRAVLEQEELRDSLVFTMSGMSEKYTLWFLEDISVDPVLNRLRGDIQELYATNKPEDIKRLIADYKDMKISTKAVRNTIKKGQDLIQIEGFDIKSTEEDFLQTTNNLYNDKGFRDKFDNTYPEITSLSQFREKIKADYNIVNESFLESIVKTFESFKEQIGNDKTYIILPGKEQKIYFDSAEDKDKALIGNMLMLKAIVEDPTGETWSDFVKQFPRYIKDWYTMGKEFLPGKWGGSRGDNLMIAIFTFNITSRWKYSRLPTIGKDGLESKKPKVFKNEEGKKIDPVQVYEREMKEYTEGKRPTAPTLEGVEGNMDHRESFFKELERDSSPKEKVRIREIRKKYIHIKSDKIFSTLVWREVVKGNLYGENTKTGALGRGGNFLIRTTWLNIIHRIQDRRGIFNNPDGRGLASPINIIDAVVKKSFINEIRDSKILSPEGKTRFLETLNEAYDQTKGTEAKIEKLKVQVAEIVKTLRETEKSLGERGFDLERFKPEIEAKLLAIGGEKDLTEMKAGISEVKTEIEDVKRLYKVSDINIEGELRNLVDEKIRIGLLNNDNGKAIKYLQANKASFVSMHRLGIDLDLISQIIDEKVPSEYMESMKKLARESKYDSVRERMFLPPEEGKTRGIIDINFLEDFKNSYGKVDTLKDFMDRYAPEARPVPEPVPTPERTPAPAEHTEARPVPEPVPTPERTPAATEVAPEKVVTKAEGVEILNKLERHYIDLGQVEAAEAIRDYKLGLQEADFNEGSMKDLELDIKAEFAERGLEEPNIKSVLETTREVKLSRWERVKRLGRKIVTKGARR